MYIAVVSNVINVAGNLIGVFVLHAGVAGVAWPSLIARTFSAVAVTVLCFRKGNGGWLCSIPVGNSDLNVSRICMGCMGFGDAGNGQHSREIIECGLELGINFFDTAIAYQSGTSEQYLGRALRDYAKREDIVAATKFLPRTQEEIEKGITGQQHIERMLDKSLVNLGMDQVDLYIYHMWDHQTPLYDIMDGLNQVVKSGKARYIGISNCYAYQLAKGDGKTLRRGQYCHDSLQCIGRRKAGKEARRNIKEAFGRQLCETEI